MTTTKRMIFFDIDGTLLDHHKQLPASAKEAVLALKDAGHEVAFATGRSPFMLKALQDELDIHSFVCFNGQYVMLDNKVIYQHPIPSDVLHSLSAHTLQIGHPLVYLDHEAMRSSTPFHARIEAGIGSLQYKHPVCDPEYYKERHIYQSMLFCTEEEELEYRQRFPQLEFVRWHPAAMDVLPSGGSKAQGIKRYIEHLGFAKEDVYAFGDNLNDLEMFCYVGHSVAMGNSPDSVKEAARYITKDVSQDGIAHGLKLVGLLQ